MAEQIITGQREAGSGRAHSLTQTGPFHLTLDLARLQAGLVATSTAVIIIGILAQLYLTFFGFDTPVRRLRPFNLDEELSLPTWYASFLFLTCSALLSVIAITARRHAQAHVLHWMFLALVFVGLSMEEVVGLHELWGRFMRANFVLPPTLRHAGVIPLFAVAVILAAAYWRFVWALPNRARLFFILSGAMVVSGAVLMELVGSYLFVEHGQFTSIAGASTTFEEILEISGVTLFAWALIDYIKVNFKTVSLHLS